MRPNHKSSPPPPIRKLAKEDAKQAVLGMAAVAQRPLLVGVVAVRLGVLWSLEDTEGLFEDLVGEGQLRHLTAEEQTRYGLQEGYLLAGVNNRK